MLHFRTHYPLPVTGYWLPVTGYQHMNYLWHTFLYDPLLNALIALYNGPARQNLGIALVELTVLLRILLLPLTVISWRARTRYDSLRHKVHVLEETHRNDAERRKEALRELLKRHHINPWAKASVLAIQFVVLIVLYQVFVDAVRHNDFTGLYIWNTAPDFLNTRFLGLDLSHRSIIWPALIGILLYLDLWLDQRKRRGTLTNSDVAYRVTFPTASLLILYALPTGKSVFVLTSILFTLIIEGVRKVLFRPKSPAERAEDETPDDTGGELVE